MEDILLDFPEEVRRILKDPMDADDEWLILHPNGKDLTIDSNFDTCYTWNLTLTDVSGLPEQAAEGWNLWRSDLNRDGDRYVLTCNTEYPDGEESLEMVHTMPWLEMVIMSWLGFGGAMGIVCVIAERNK